MKIVILGSTGYLGTKLSFKLMEKEHDVLCLKLSKEKEDGIRHFYNIEEIEYLNEDFDCLINLCCRYQRNNVKDIEIFDSNLYTPLKVYLRFSELNIKKFITIDTSLPKETNIYSLAKKEFADIIKNYSKERKISTINVLLENFYGPDEPKDRFIPSTISKLKVNEEILLTTGEQKRDWIYVDDVINGLIKICENQNLPNYIDFPLGSGENVEIREVIRYLATLTNSKSVLNFGAIPKRTLEPDTLADTTLMKKYGIEIQYNWLEGFKRMV